MRSRGRAKASQTITWLLYIYIKPETSVKVKNFTAFPVFLWEFLEGVLYAA